MLEKIIGAVLFVVGIQAGGTGKRLISSQCTVTHGADSNRYWLAGKDGLVSVDHESLYLNIRLFCLVALILRVLFFPGRALKFFCKINDISGNFRSRGPDSKDESGGKEEKRRVQKIRRAFLSRLRRFLFFFASLIPPIRFYLLFACPFKGYPLDMP